MQRDKRSQRRLSGTCKLTLRSGPFVDSHILPEALTRPSVRGNPLYQYGNGARPTRRWSSWYDSQLVTAEGEQYLAELDTWAISVLRDHKLVWSGWGQAKDLGSSDHTKMNDFLGARLIRGLDTKRLRLFFHSLLWRAAASERFEFQDIAVSDEDLETLRQSILGLVEPPLSFYPIQLTQLSTKGVMHNQTPIQDVKYVPNLLVPSAPRYTLPTFRFYFDGLISHIHRALPLAYSVAALGNLVVGAVNDLVLSTVTFEESLQARDMRDVLSGSGVQGYDV
jgi:hypothetical protein